MTIKKYVVGVALGAAGFIAISDALSQSLTPEVEAKARRLLRDQIFQLYHSEWRSGLQPVEAAQTMVYATTLTPEREAVARQMLRQKMAELYGTGTTATPPMMASSSTGTLTPELETRARQMVRERMAELYAQDAAPKPRMVATIRPNSEALYPRPEATQFASPSANTPLEQLKHYYITGQIGPQEFYREVGRLGAQK